MLTWIKRFFYDQQTFSSVVGEVVGIAGTAGAFAAANPELIDLGPWGAIAGAFAAYLGGSVSGRTKTQ